MFSGLGDFNLNFPLAGRVVADLLVRKTGEFLGTVKTIVGEPRVTQLQSNIVEL